MAIENDLLAIARRDLQTSELILGTSNDEIMQNMAAYHTQQAIEKIIKHMLVEKRGFVGTEHDIERLATEAKAEWFSIPEWVSENSYVISKWATTIRYNSNYKTNRDEITKFNSLVLQWMNQLK